MQRTVREAGVGQGWFVVNIKNNNYNNNNKIQKKRTQGQWSGLEVESAGVLVWGLAVATGLGVEGRLSQSLSSWRVGGHRGSFPGPPPAWGVWVSTVHQCLRCRDERFYAQAQAAAGAPGGAQSIRRLVGGGSGVR